MAGLELADPSWDVWEADLGHTRGHLEEEGLEFLASGSPPSALNSFRPITFRICDFGRHFWAAMVKETRCLLPCSSRESRVVPEKDASGSPGDISPWQQGPSLRILPTAGALLLSSSICSLIFHLQATGINWWCLFLFWRHQVCFQSLGFKTLSQPFWDRRSSDWSRKDSEESWDEFLQLRCSAS